MATPPQLARRARTWANSAVKPPARPRINWAASASPSKWTRKSTIVATVFMLTGLLVAWQVGNIGGHVKDSPPRSEAGEKAYIAAIAKEYPSYPESKRAELIEMGNRVCNRLEQNWEPERILAMLSQPSGWEDPTPWGLTESELDFWAALERAAGEHICPAQAPKVKDFHPQIGGVKLEEYS